MHRVAEDVFQIPLFPRHALNAYLVGDVIVDAGVPQSAKKVLDAVRGLYVRAHAITHAHADHVGGSKAVADALDIPVWAPANDAREVEAGRQVMADTRAKGILSRGNGWPPTPVARRLAEGDEVGAGFVVFDAPGHSPGHVVYWREADRTLVAGDVWFNLNLLTLRPGLHEPPRMLTVDPARNRISARRLADLRPALVLFGHGPPLRDPERLLAFAAARAA